MSRTLRSLSTVALAAVLMACGGGSPQELLDRAPAAMEEQGTVGYQQGVIVTDESGQILVDTTTVGRQDLATSAQRMVIHLGEAAGADVPVGAAVEVIVDGTVAYVASPEIQRASGVEWTRFDLSETAELLPGFDAAGQQASGPLALMHDLRGAVDEVDELGEAEIDGVTTHHLRVTVDVQRAIDNAAADRQADLRRAAEELGVPDRYPMEVWLGDDALPRRIVTLIESQDPTFGTTTRELRTDLFDYGETVDVTPPAEEDVVDFSELLAELGRADGAGS